LNILDILVIVIMALAILLGVWRGFVRTVLGFISIFLAIFLTNLLYPSMGRFLRGIDGLYNSLSSSISRLLGLESIIENAGYATQSEIISSLPLPSSWQNSLLENNNPIIHNALGAVDFQGFISGFLAGIVINIISMVVVFILIYLGLILLIRILDLVAKLPVVNAFNKLLGGAVGALKGLFLTWIILAIVVLYFSANSSADMVNILETSVIARHFHERNFALELVLRLFP